MDTPSVRMYVDENGNHHLTGDLSKPDRRFLCMTGVIMPIKEHDGPLTQYLNQLKVKYFGSDYIVLHRRELISAKPPYESLADETTREEFNADLLNIVQKVRYKVISVVIDKMTLVDKYGLLNARDPYALALEIIMQRYQYWMQDYGYSGDILAEARGKKEDGLTKQTYNEIYLGRGYTPLRDANRYFSSSQIKLKTKKENIPGLQFVDLISHPARRHILSSNGLAENIKKSSFEQDIVDVLCKSKFRRKGHNIDGVGAVLFPK